MYFLEIINRNVSSKSKYLGLKIEFAFENNQSLEFLFLGSDSNGNGFSKIVFLVKLE
ncbi:hypothetical protein FH589_08025 [Leptospira interrogans]|uniref:hypothetical protein n=1 Tax=Leptospira interrogans TaxID=173 RepID=UPI0012B5F4A2|nr:hypothetical protein [Leptospira interrogans]UML70712.1 hypothetical protein FH589_08025 [Leptospira interrogans]